MSAEEDLIDYSDDEIQQNDAAPATTAANGAAKKGDLVTGKGGGATGGYVGVHSSGFRDFLLLPEIVRAVADCGFEHPSEG